MPQRREDSNEKKRIQAVQTTLDIVEVLRENGGAGVTEIARELDVTKGTVHNHLATLEANDYVIKDAEETYHLGLCFLDVAHRAKSRVSTLDVARTEVDKLAERSGETALFTVEEHGVGVCLHVAYGERAVQTPLHVGYRSELHHTAVGKAILAHLPEGRVEAIVEERGLSEQTDRTITDTDDLFETLEAVRERGIAYNEGETIQGLVGVGAPVTDQSGTVLGALSVIGPASRMGEGRLRGDLSELIRRSVNVIEINLTSL
ncbi:IclR family transcriptional regulator [Natronosalvus caseinilyticus]|uniref:IclR family transcriptional regulator n=1 Tax=Natronosalvus caseinilyticus TaxID=2953747 RepID=UPI0028B0189F|nr:IclR family transcriptional regulator [Natronosalvus caseinilyticus]